MGTVNKQVCLIHVLLSFLKIYQKNCSLVYTWCDLYLGNDGKVSVSGCS